MDIKLIDVNKVTDTKYLNLYACKYQKENDIVDYYVASRRKIENLSANNAGKIHTDVVRIVPYFFKDNELFVVLTKEFRYPLNSYVYSIPAGLIDQGETQEDAVKREVFEEIGGEVLSTKLLAGPSYASVGLTDEMLVSYMAEINLTNTQNLDGNEVIEYFVMPFKDIKRFADEEVYDFQAKVLLYLFYYEMLPNNK